MKRAITAALAVLFFTLQALFSPFTVYAGTVSSSLSSAVSSDASNDAASYFTYKNGYYFVTNPESSNPKTSLSIALDHAAPSVNLTTLDKYYTYTWPNGKTECCIKAEDFKNLLSINQQCENWVSANLSSIVPNGTPVANIPAVVAAWVAAHMTYDDAAVNDDALCHSYQSALSCFTSGTGVCSTYALAFNTLVQSVPVNPQSGLTDYSCTDPLYYDTRYVNNEDHAWSAIRFGSADSWHYYDITYYDNGSYPARSEYLNMDQSLLADADHSNAYAFS